LTLADLSIFLERYRGGVSVVEGLALSRYAEQCCNGIIVEIGSFKGKSSVALAAGQARGSFGAKGLVYCIEPHLPFVGLYGGVFGPADRRDFYTVMLETGFFDRVCLVNLASDIAGGGWVEPIGLLFVDGDHSLDGVRSDIATWERHVATGGAIIFDDAIDTRCGAHHVIKDLIASGRFERSETVGKMVVLHKIAAAPAPKRERGKRILVACHEMVMAGGLYRFERFGRVIQRFDHHLAFLAFSDRPHRGRQTDFPVLTFDEASKTDWDATFVPGAGFPDKTIDRFARLKAPSFGVRVQHILNDMTRKPGFLKVNRSFAPDVVIFNNRHWRAGDFTDFQGDAFHFLEGAVDADVVLPDPRRFLDRSDRPFVVGGLTTKNVNPLIDAIRVCGQSVHLHLFGPPGHIAKRARDLVKSGQLQLLGVLNDAQLPRFYADIDCIAHTDTFAGWANLAAEGMASGVPVICTPHGTGAFAEHEETALVVPEPSAAALARAILRLRDDPELAGRLAQNARERVKALSWHSYSADLLHLIEKPACRYYTWSPELQLFGKWPESQRLDGLDLILDACVGQTVCDLGAGEGVVSRRLLDRGAAIVHGFEHDLSRVLLANAICSDFAGSHFWQADLSDWSTFETQHAPHLQPTYDIVLYLGLHHHLPATSRMLTLAGAAKLASGWLAVRTPTALFRADKIELTLSRAGFSLVSSKSDAASPLGGCYIFRRSHIERTK